MPGLAQSYQENQANNGIHTDRTYDLQYIGKYSHPSCNYQIQTADPDDCNLFRRALEVSCAESNLVEIDQFFL